jgi:sulfide:quinone oxidoreductase
VQGYKGEEQALAQAGKIVAVPRRKEAEMADIRVVTDRFSVAPQIALEDFAQLASAGYRHIINNRPDGESPDQPSSAVIEVAAKQAGLTYVHAPFVGQPTADAVKAALSASSKTLAFCRSGTRSVTAWAIAEASQGEEAQYIVEAAQDAGYNLSGMNGLLKQLGAK